MRFSRLVWALIAGLVGIAAVFALQLLETTLLGAASSSRSLVVLLGSGAAVLWLADRFDLIESPFAESPFGMREAADNAAMLPDLSAWEDHFVQGQASGRAGDLVAAVRHFQRAAERAPREPYPSYELGYTFFLLGDVDAALNAFRRTNQLAEGFFLVQTEVYLCEAVQSGLLDMQGVAAIRRIQALTDAGKSADAEVTALSRLLIKVAPTCALGHYYLGKAVMATDPAESERALRRCLECGPDDTVRIDALTHIGVHRRAAGDVESARAIWEDVVVSFPTNPHAKSTAFFL
jgi:tetratricopeptide (TPR) repeat protein